LLTSAQGAVAGLDRRRGEASWGLAQASQALAAAAVDQTGGKWFPLVSLARAARGRDVAGRGGRGRRPVRVRCSERGLTCIAIQKAGAGRPR